MVLGEIAKNAVGSTSDDNTGSAEGKQVRGAHGSEFIGRKDDEEKLLEMLCHPSNQERDLSVLSIVGMGGIGKTALARRIHDNEKIDVHFGGKKMWICVSENFNITRLINEMLESVTSTKGDLSNMDAVIRKIQQELKGKKFLLVLDDVWNDNEALWDAFKASLHRIGGLQGSVLLLTTRSKEVARAAKAVFSLELNLMSDDESWELFNQNMLISEIPSDASRLEEVGRRVVNKCKGVPLAIKVIAGLMRSSADWEKIEKSNLWELPRDRNQIMPSLLLSYNQLSSPVKQCFAYWAIFRKGSVIERHDLIPHWVAQGFLDAPTTDLRRMTMEERGEEYIQVLLDHFLLEDAGFGADIVYRFKMHDLVHDLAVFVAKDVLLIGEGEGPHQDGNYRHLVFTCDKAVDFAPGNIERNLRTISYEGVKLKSVSIDARYLRTLVLRDTGITEVPPSVRLLKHLRFLDLAHNPIRMLPDFICELDQLQTLELQFCKWLTELPTTVSKMVKLRHVVTSYPLSVPKGLSKLTEMQTLPDLLLKKDGKGWTIDELGDLHEVRGNIYLHGLEHVQNKAEARKASFDRKTKVQRLSLSWSKEREENSADSDDEAVLDVIQPHQDIESVEIINFYGKKFPPWIMNMAVINEGQGGNPKPLSHLTVVKLLNCRRCRMLPTLGQLPSLKLLRLSGLEVECIGVEFYVGDNDVSKHQNVPAVKAFESLKELRITGLRRLNTWMAPSRDIVAAAFPRLEVMEVTNCPKLENVSVLDYGSLKSLRLCRVANIKSLDIIKVCTGLTSLKMSNMSLVTSLPQELANCKKLRVLEIDNFEELRALPTGLQSLVSLRTLIIRSKALTSLPDDLFQGLSSLRELVIYGCPGLTKVSTSLNGCTSLEKLWIFDCGLEEDVSVDLSNFQSLADLFVSYRSVEALRCVLEAVQDLPGFISLGIHGFRDDEEFADYFSDVAPFLHLRSLKELYLVGQGGIRSFPEQLGLLTGITDLHLWRFLDVEETPGWILNLTSLESLELRECHNLKCLPSKEDLLGLTRLHNLTIWECPVLAERCAKDKGTEWAKIEHLNYIKIDGEEII